jgi:hypothetical protein
VKSPAGALRFRSEFDAFLFAPVGADESGMPLSVVSVLARLDLDPWQEAAQLAALSQESAAQKMVSILDTVPNPPLLSSDILAVATRLVAMLPRQTPLPGSPRRAFSMPPGTTLPRAHANALILISYLLFMITSQFLMGPHLSPHAASQLPPPSGSASSPISPAPSAK